MLYVKTVYGIFALFVSIDINCILTSELLLVFKYKLINVQNHSNAIYRYLLNDVLALS